MLLLHQTSISIKPARGDSLAASRPMSSGWYADRMTKYRTVRVDEGPDWVVIATRDDNSQESLTRHSSEVEAEAMADRLTAITRAKFGA
jgi:hypothetical protein